MTGRAGGAGSKAGAAEASLALRGSAVQDGQFVAFIEDMNLHAIQRLKSGDAVAAGRLARITLDAVEYETKGNIIRVAIGQSLAGVLFPATRPAQGSGDDAGPGKPRRPCPAAPELSRPAVLPAQPRRAAPLQSLPGRPAR